MGVLISLLKVGDERFTLLQQANSIGRDLCTSFCEPRRLHVLLWSSADTPPREALQLSLFGLQPGHAALNSSLDHHPPPSPLDQATIHGRVFFGEEEETPRAHLGELSATTMSEDSLPSLAIRLIQHIYRTIYHLKISFHYTQARSQRSKTSLKQRHPRRFPRSSVLNDTQS